MNNNYAGIALRRNPGILEVDMGIMYRVIMIVTPDNHYIKLPPLFGSKESAETYAKEESERTGCFCRVVSVKTFG